jgi:hypothetical protein
MTQHLKVVLCALSLAGVLASARPATAQVVHMNSAQKMQYFGLFTEAARAKVTEGKAGTARLICITGFHLIQSQLKIPRWIERNKQALVAYDAVCSPLWKGHRPDPSGGDAVVKAYSDEIADYGRALGFAPFANPTVSPGYEQHKRTIDALKIVDEAQATAVAFIDKLPNTDVLMSKPPRGFEALYPHLLSIVTGRLTATVLEEKEAVPAVLAALEAIDRSIDADDKPGALIGAAADMTRWVALLRTARPTHADVARYTQRIAAVEQEADRKEKAYIAATRLPKSKWRGARGAEAVLTQAYAARFPKEHVERLVIATDDWGPARGEGWWSGDVWKWSVFSRLPQVSVAVRQTVKGETQYRVFTVTFARERKGSGWTAPYVLSTDHGRRILKPNIAK